MTTRGWQQQNVPGQQVMDEVMRWTSIFNRREGCKGIELQHDGWVEQVPRRMSSKSKNYTIRDAIKGKDYMMDE
jgi:hypothetical protein